MPTTALAMPASPSALRWNDARPADVTVSRWPRGAREEGHRADRPHTESGEIEQSARLRSFDRQRKRSDEHAGACESMQHADPEERAVTVVV